MTTYAVTGATGGLGSASITALLDRGVAPRDIVAVVRDAAKAADLEAKGIGIRVADYADRPSLDAAFAGVDKLLFISGSEVGARVAQHTAVVDAAAAAGVGLVAYTSILRADSSPLLLAQEHLATEKALAASGVPFVLLRNGWYWDNYAASAPTALELGVFYGSAGDGKVAGAARSDYAAAAAAALVSADPGAVYELAGTQHLTYADIAATFAEIGGTPVRYENLPQQDYAAALVKAGLPEGFAGVLADSDAGAAIGGLDSDSDDLVTLVGRPLVPFADVIRPALTQS
ncbi:NmrA family NAD(P)-binding protein [Gordonia soli]|uniref:Putative NAD(P)H--quinone oxidoreductase n=1 Tax=Gordonia soli NBRC 108243 TaxID=1223545 RepID=M0QPQ1_9ACTN|nr:NAD(P)H-binding protein [Gordonia soli]GAC70553.1 putative NAD(P)H--quinone oxidoreductase [Gordonia soli NBRC 108243]